MLDCRGDRLDYGKQLAPPSGFEFDRAVAVTYSVDLQTLLSIPIALYYSQTFEGDISEARVELLDAIRRFSDKVVVYHQKGRLHVPEKTNWLFAYLEESLASILPDSAFSSFHPKIWLVRYRCKDEKEPAYYRMLVLSRNLTFDRSWDVAVSLDGRPGASPPDRNRPLIDFLGWLNRQRPFKWAADWSRELASVSFECPDPFHTLRFHPIGIDGYKDNPMEKEEAYRTLVISPFLHAKAIQTLSQNASQRFDLFSEAHALQMIDLGVSKALQPYALKNEVIDGESHEAAEDGNPAIQKQHLHAKVFIFQKANGQCHWFLGSANATEAAFRRNVEFMVELQTDHHRAKPAKIVSQLAGPDGPEPFEAFVPGKIETDEDAEHLEVELRRFEHALLGCPMSGIITAGAEPEAYDLEIEFEVPDFPKRLGLSVGIRPFGIEVPLAELAPASRQTLRFAGIGEVHLSRFVEFRIQAKDLPPRRFLVKIPIHGLPRERLDRIFRRIIDSEDKFFQYLRLLLSVEITKSALIRVSKNQERKGSLDIVTFFDAPLYEQLLVAASRHPSKLLEVDRVVQVLSRDAPEVIPGGFLAFWEAFRPFAHSKKAP